MKTKYQKPFLEVVPHSPDTSLRLYHNAHTGICSMRSWHFHPEIELVCLPRGRGQLFVGNKPYKYQDGVVILLSSNIPHKSFDWGFESELYEEYVLQVLPLTLNTLLNQLPEFGKLKQLINTAQEGIVLPLSKQHNKLKQQFEQLPYMSSLKRWLTFVEILDELTNSTYEVLGVTSGNINAQQVARIEKVFAYIAAHYTQSISSQTVAESLHLTDSSFCRFFQKHTQKTFKLVLNEYRIMQACKLLNHTDKSIETISYEVGFNNQSFFNRIFKEIMGATPLQYRRAQYLQS